MKTNTKRMLSFLLALALILSLLPILPRAEAAGYQLWLGSVQVTDANKDHIPVNAGTASFDPATNTLTLNSVGGFNGYSEVSIQVGMDSYDTRSVLIKSEIPLTIKGDATVYDTADFGIYCRDLTIDANLAFMNGCDMLIDGTSVTMNGGELYSKRCSNIARDFIYVSSFTMNGGKVELIATNAEIGLECYGTAAFNGGTFLMRECWNGIHAGTVQVKSPAELFVETKGIAVQADTINVTGSEITCPVEGKVWNQSFEEIEKDCMIGLPDCPNAADTVY